MPFESTGVIPFPVRTDTVLHRPVLVREMLELLAPPRGATVVDCTLGLGGHAEALLEAVGPTGRLIGLDRDGDALQLATERLRDFGDCFEAVHADYRDLARVLDERNILDVDTVLADLGLSSFQIESRERGFSFVLDGPLDMRMDRSRGETAADLLARISEAELARILREFGEERAARRIARSLTRERAREPLRRTGQVARLVEKCLGGRRGADIHPATRTFQALRIAVNRELEELDRFIELACHRLGPGGRAAFISFHSLEDRIVKQTLNKLSPHCTCPPALPQCVCGKPGVIARLNRRVVRPGQDEIRGNPRSRSARLRAAVRLWKGEGSLDEEPR